VIAPTPLRRPGNQHDPARDLSDAFDNFRSLLTRLDRQHSPGGHALADDLRAQAARHLDDLAQQAQDHLARADPRRTR
jgi:hypothetical protein